MLPDFASKEKQTFRRSFSKFRSDTALVQQLRQARPAASVLLHAVFPRGSDEGAPKTRAFRRAGWWDAQRNNHYAGVGLLNRGLREWAEAHEPHVRFVDCGAGLLRRAAPPAAQLQPNASGAPYLPVELMYDLLHLTPAGYARWADCLGAELEAVRDQASVNLLLKASKQPPLLQP